MMHKLSVAILAILVAGSANAVVELYNKEGKTLTLFGTLNAAHYLTMLDKDKKQ